MAPKKKKAPRKTAKKKTVKRKIIKKAARKTSKRKLIKKRPLKKKITAVKKAKENIIGLVMHYFPHVNAAVIKLKAPLAVGDTIKVKGHTTDFTQTISSMQINRTPINQAKKGDEIGLLVNSRVRQHDVVCKV